MKMNPRQEVRIKYLSVKEYAELKGFHPQTIREKIKDGKLKAEQDGKGCAYRIPIKNFILF